MRESKKIITEPARQIPVRGEADVLVCGGGPAGVAAAIVAARNGAKTILIEQDGCLGGTATAGMVNRLGPFHDQKKIIVRGIPWEILEKLVILGAAPKPQPCSPDDHDNYWIPFDPEAMKYVVEQMVEQAGVQILLYSLVSAVLIKENCIRGVVVENKSGHARIVGHVVVDATGDGDIAARAGASYTKGTSGDGQMQDMTLMFKMHNVDCEKLVNYLQNYRKDFIAKVAQAQTAGISLPSYYLGPGTNLPKGEVYYNIVHASTQDGTNTLELSKAQIEARRKIWRTVKFLRKNVPGHEKAYLCATAPRIGVRETRHILGEYTLTGLDVLSAKRFPDGVIQYACYIDRALVQLKNTRLQPGTSYEIPYRCLIPKGIDNLLVAGRCFSATHEAAASARMIPCCMGMGEAAGTAAALSVHKNIIPRDIEPLLLRNTLRNQGVNI